MESMYELRKVSDPVQPEPQPEPSKALDALNPGDLLFRASKDEMAFIQLGEMDNFTVFDMRRDLEPARAKQPLLVDFLS